MRKFRNSILESDADTVVYISEMDANTLNGKHVADRPGYIPLEFKSCSKEFPENEGITWMPESFTECFR